MIIVKEAQDSNHLPVSRKMEFNLKFCINIDI